MKYECLLKRILRTNNLTGVIVRGEGEEEQRDEYGLTVLWLMMLKTTKRKIASG
jgi:hypothetical protein